MKEGRLVGESVHGVRERVNEEGRAQREINEGGEAGRGEHGVRGGRGCWRQGGRGGRGCWRQGDKGRTGRRGRKEGRTGGRETPMISARHGLCTSMPVVVSIHSVLTCWREGLRVVGGGGQGWSQRMREEPAAVST